MSIFLSVLKVIGIILGILLAILLALVLFVLFLPICYRIDGDFHEKSEIRGQFSWLFFIRVRFLAEGKRISVWLSMFGIKKTLYPAVEKKERRFKKQTEKTKEKPLENEPEETDDEDGASIQAAEISAFSVSDSHAEQEKNKENPEAFCHSDSEKQKSRKSLQKFHPWNMIKTWIGKIKKFFVSLKENFSNIKNELSDETNKRAVSHICKELKTLIRQIGPRRGKAQLSYSAGDPAFTGKLTGFFSIMPLFYKKGVHVVPDFASDRFYIQGNFRVNGHIQVFHLLGIFFRVYKDKNIKKLIQKFK